MKVVCIVKNSRLQLYKIYEATECYIPSIGFYHNHYTIDDDYEHMYPRSWFVTLQEFREIKLKNIFLFKNQ